MQEPIRRLASQIKAAGFWSPLAIAGITSLAADLGRRVGSKEVAEAVRAQWSLGIAQRRAYLPANTVF